MNQLDFRPPATSSQMQCMEVWGGNQKANNRFELTGLDVWIYSRPHGDSESGGDVYYLSACASGRISRLLLADVSGHGPSVSKAAIELRNLMRRNINVVKQSRFVRAMNRQFAELQENEAFATAIVGTFFAPTRSLTLCNAGHPSPFRYSQQQGRWEIIEHHPTDPGPIANVPLGVVEHSDYSETAMRLERGDLAMFFSDALTESRLANEQMVGLQGLLQIVQEGPTEQPGEIIPYVLSRLEAEHPENSQQDDVSIVVVRATGGGPPWRDNLLAPFRMLHGVTDRSKLT